MRVPNYREPVVSLLKGYLHEIEKPFARFSQIGWSIIDVNRNLLEFDVDIYGERNANRYWEEHQQKGLVYNVRNAILSQIGDLVPCPRFSVLLSHSSIDVFEKPFEGLFYDPSKDEFLLRSASVPVIEIVLECREKYRKAFQAAWRGLPIIKQ